MDNELIEKYKKEFLRMYGSSSPYRVKPVAAEVEPPKTQEPRPEEQIPLNQQGDYQEGTPYDKEDSTDPNGRLIVMATAVSRLYPVENAKVTVFTGDYAAPNRYRPYRPKRKNQGVQSARSVEGTFYGA